VDVTFTAVARIYPGKALALVLTGMGADGREGARLLKQGGSTVWAQDEKSCVVYGMPAAVAEAGLADQVLPLLSIGPGIAHEVGAWTS
jgi:two-component system chemotaxis response regulator CheB